jgi:hypothetical protein
MQSPACFVTGLCTIASGKGGKRSKMYDLTHISLVINLEPIKINTLG